MAVSKIAHVMSTEKVGADTLLLDLWTDEPLGFVGGQYLIVDSGIVLPSGKAVKRAYSLLTADTEQCRFQLAVKRIPGGLGSGFVHSLQAGMNVSFSGPWGMCVPPERASGRILILATDTGITAALGFLLAKRFAPLLPSAMLVWLRTSAAYFLPDEFVKRRVPSACGDVRVDMIPGIGDPERIPHVRSVLHQILTRYRFAQTFLAGDGAVNRILIEDLAAAGIRMEKGNVESFFNMPKKST